jgi:hypothetical protein
VCWVSMVGTGGACLAIMIPPSVLSISITWRTWRSEGQTGRTATSTP